VIILASNKTCISIANKQCYNLLYFHHCTITQYLDKSKYSCHIKELQSNPLPYRKNAMLSGFKVGKLVTPHHPHSLLMTQQHLTSQNILLPTTSHINNANTTTTTSHLTFHTSNPLLSTTSLNSLSQQSLQQAILLLSQQIQQITLHLDTTHSTTQSTNPTSTLTYSNTFSHLSHNFPFSTLNSPLIFPLPNLLLSPQPTTTTFTKP
jgi:hypothetical protein